MRLLASLDINFENQLIQMIVNFLSYMIQITYKLLSEDLKSAFYFLS